jgi:hypothetical protein
VVSTEKSLPVLRCTVRPYTTESTSRGTMYGQAVRSRANRDGPGAFGCASTGSPRSVTKRSLGRSRPVMWRQSPSAVGSGSAALP